MKKNTQILVTIATGLICASIATGVTYALTKPSAEEQKLIDTYRLMKDDWLYGNEEAYVDSMVMNGLATGVASTSDDSYFIYTDNKEDQGLSTSGLGFGFVSHWYDGGLYVADVYNDSAAGRAGLKKGDILRATSANGWKATFKGCSLSVVHNIISMYTSDQEVTFTVERDGKEIELMMTKGTYSQNLVDVLQYPDSSNSNTMVVRINTFLGDPYDALKGVLMSYQDKVNNLVFDLRGNSGGYVSQAAAISRMFVKKGTLIYDLRDKNFKSLDSSYQQTDPSYSFNNYYIIQDGNSASASEIFTLAMRAGTNCKVLGFKSYGKGIAQNFKTYSDGSILRYTSAYVYGPERENETMYEEGEDSDSLICVHGKGILPDEEYSFDFEKFNTQADYTTSIGVSEYYQNLMLELGGYAYPEEIPQSYSSTYHFTDAVTNLGKKFSRLYADASLAIPFDEEGKITMAFNNKFIKLSYDSYLTEFDKMTDYYVKEII